jgi:hypothetical protein
VILRNILPIAMIETSKSACFNRESRRLELLEIPASAAVPAQGVMRLVQSVLISDYLMVPSTAIVYRDQVTPPKTWSIFRRNERELLSYVGILT